MFNKTFNERLLHHPKGEANCSVREFTNDSKGYVLSLKQPKFLFGHKSKIGQAVLAKVTQEQLSDDQASLYELYFTINDCLVSLDQLQYHADL